MIYKKLREYIEDNGTGRTIIFGDLISTDCEFWYDGKTYAPTGAYRGEYDFLLDYYVMGISPQYKIVDDKIIPYLHITLSKELR